MRSNDEQAPWRMCPNCGRSGPGTAEIGWVPAGAVHPPHPHLAGPGHLFTCRHCGHAWLRSSAPGAR